MRHEKPQKGNPHKLTIKQHVHSAACVARFADVHGRVAVKRHDRADMFLAQPRGDTFVAMRAWSQRLEHGLFRKVEDDFQAAIDTALNGGPVDHATVTNYLIIWAIRDHFNCLGRDSVQLLGVAGDTLTKDQEEILDKKGAMFVRSNGQVPAHLSLDLRAWQLFDSNREMLAGARWRVGTTPAGMALACPDAFCSGGLGVLPINRTTALLAVTEPGPPDVMTSDLVHHINSLVLDDARTLVFAHPTDLQVILDESYRGERARSRARVQALSAAEDSAGAGYSPNRGLADRRGIS
jgi:hypothetical protein